MKITATDKMQSVASLDELKRFVTIYNGQVSSILNGGISFTDNFNAKILTVKFPASNTVVTTDHGLGSVPTGYIPISLDAAMTVFSAKQPNTSKTLYLQSSAAGTATLLVFA